MQPSTFTERDFPIHTWDTAPAPSKTAINWYQSNFGLVPNLAGIMAEAPALLLSYWNTQTNVAEFGTLTRQEMNIVQTAVAHTNRCQYCVAGHTAFGKTEYFGNTDEQLSAVRGDEEFEDPKLNVLRDFTLQVLETKGRITSAGLVSFLNAGYTRAQALEIVAHIAAKVMSNFANQIALTPVDGAFASFASSLPYHEERQVIIR